MSKTKVFNFFKPKVLSLAINFFSIYQVSKTLISASDNPSYAFLIFLTLVPSANSFLDTAEAPVLLSISQLRNLLIAQNLSQMKKSFLNSLSDVLTFKES